MGKNFRFLILFGLLVHILGLWSTLTAEAAESRRLFAGGMFFTMAPVNVATVEENFLSMGIGGRIYFYAGDFLRIGGMGSVLKRTVGDNGDDFQLGGGGLLLNYCHRWSFFELAAGLLVGGQAFKMDKVIDYSGDEYRIRRHKEGHWFLTPQLDFTFWVTKKIQLFLLTEYRHPYFTNYQLGHTVQFYLGVHFSH